MQLHDIAEWHVLNFCNCCQRRNCRQCPEHALQCIRDVQGVMVNVKVFHQDNEQCIVTVAAETGEDTTSATRQTNQRASSQTS